jgi:hypothetical protein
MSKETETFFRSRGGSFSTPLAFSYLNYVMDRARIMDPEFDDDKVQQTFYESALRLPFLEWSWKK